MPNKVISATYRYSLIDFVKEKGVFGGRENSKMKAYLSYALWSFSLVETIVYVIIL